MKSTYKSETMRDCSPLRASEPSYHSPLGRLIHEWEHPEIGPIRIINRAEEGESFTPVVEVDHPGVYADLGDLEDAGLLIDALGEEIARLAAERASLRESVAALVEPVAASLLQQFQAGKTASTSYWSEVGQEKAYSAVLALLGYPGEERT